MMIGIGIAGVAVTCLAVWLMSSWILVVLACAVACVAACCYGIIWLWQTLITMANCDERDDHFDPDPKPVKRRSF